MFAITNCRTNWVVLFSFLWARFCYKICVCGCVSCDNGDEATTTTTTTKISQDKPIQIGIVTANEQSYKNTRGIQHSIYYIPFKWKKKKIYTQKTFSLCPMFFLNCFYSYEMGILSEHTRTKKQNKSLIQQVFISVAFPRRRKPICCCVFSHLIYILLYAVCKISYVNIKKNGILESLIFNTIHSIVRKHTHPHTMQIICVIFFLASFLHPRLSLVPVVLDRNTIRACVFSTQQKKLSQCINVLCVFFWLTHILEKKRETQHSVEHI